ncbi:chaperonin GroEL, partial [Patescibacteria group bacterium]|nr:chaperonin GroEL [Patescibacteria group bacterium]
IKTLMKGSNGLQLRHGIEAATTDAISKLSSMSRSVEDSSEIRHVATISAENEELGLIIADTIQAVGNDGVVTVEESQLVGVTSTVVEGMEFASGFVSHYLVTNKERMEAVYENVSILVTTKKISAIKDLVPLLEKLATLGKKELVIIAEDIEGEALGAVVLNKMRGIFSILAIKAPGFGERKQGELEDIALSVGATVVTDALHIALETGDSSVLGSAVKVISTKDTTVLIGGKSKKVDIEQQIHSIKTQISLVGGSKIDAFTKEYLYKRIARLTSGIAVIKVGAATETETKYLKLKIEDAVHATKAAIEEGVILGGGVALAKVATQLSLPVEKTDYARGYHILVEALSAPLTQIILNTGSNNAKAIVTLVQQADELFGYDATADFSKDIELVDMMKKGIIDPVKVTRTALQHAASAAGILLTTDVAIADDEETTKQKLAQQNPEQ